MNFSVRRLFPSAATAAFLVFGLLALAQDPPPPAAPPAPSAPAEKPKPAAVPAEPPAAAPASAVVPAETAPPAPPLRHLDEATVPDEAPQHRRSSQHERPYHHGDEIVAIGRNAELTQGQIVDRVVAVFGSAASAGDVKNYVVSVMGNARVTGPVAGAVVSIFGNTYVNSKVDHAVVVVFGNVELGPEADVRKIVCIGGTTQRDPKAIVHGQVNDFSFPGMFADMAWLHSWVENCALYVRPLAFAPDLLWAWWIALSFLACYAVLALFFRPSVERCAQTLEQRPGFSILAALLVVLLAPIAFVLLLLTGVGLGAVPFLWTALFFAGLFGKTVMLAWLGRRILRSFGAEHTVVAVLVGGAVMLLLYTVPILGFVMYGFFGWIGLGTVMYTLLLGMKREKRVEPAVVAARSTVTADVDTSAPSLVVADLPQPPPVVPAATLPRAGFWIRIAALLLDLILVSVILTFVAANHFVLLVLAGYGAAMWKLRGSTIGGIICGLKVVRLDDRPVDWATAIVRALGCFLSLAVMGLGFIWVAFDDQKQSWHDKIAGTTVVRAPKGVSLL